jgi:hypothetical protein
VANTTAIEKEGGYVEFVCGVGVNHVALACFQDGSDMADASLNQAVRRTEGCKVKMAWDGYYYKVYRWVDGTDVAPGNDVELENANPSKDADFTVYVPLGCYLKLIIANVSRVGLIKCYV